MGSKLLTIIIYLVSLFGCSSNGIRNDNFVLKTNNKDLITNFNSARQLSDSIVTTIFNDNDILNKFYVKYGFEYYGILKDETDSLFSKPISYRFSYGLLLDNDTVGYSIIQIDTSLRIIYCDTHELIGLRMLLNKDLKIYPSEAKSIAIKNGMKSDSLSIIFKTYCYYLDTIKNFKDFLKVYNHINANCIYYWDIENECNGCLILEINAKDGNILTKGKIEYIY